MKRPEATYYSEPPRVQIDTHGEPGLDQEVLYELYATVGLNPVNIRVSRDDVMGLEPYKDEPTTFAFTPDTETTHKYAQESVQKFNETLKFYEHMDPRDMISIIALARIRTTRGF